MIKAKLKKASMFALAAVMSVGMLVGTTSLQKASAAEPTADEAQITVGKTLTINGTKFPNIENFEFELEAIKGYTNPNASTSADGQTITAAYVPLPGETQAALDGTRTNHKVTKSVGNFTTAATGDTETKKERKDAFGNIKYTTAGYYLYKMTEKVPATKVPGVVYDESNYYVVVYVVNNVDAQGNTTDGVHVESITAWHNSKNAPDANMPNLKDIANKGYTKNHDPSASSNDDNTGDNNGQRAKNNATYGQNPDNEQRWDDLGKVGISNPKNKLDATKFWNKQEMHDIIITKNVKGNLGDKTKQFEFTVTVTGLENGGEYAIEKTGTKYNETTGAAAKADNSTTKYYTKSGENYTEVANKSTLADDAVVYTKSEAELVSASVGEVNNSADKITANGEGNCTFVVKMTDDQGIKIKNLPNNVTYKVSEAASNHAPSYAVTSSNSENDFIYTAVTGEQAKAAPEETYYTTNDGTDTAVADVQTLGDTDTVYKKSANTAAAVIAQKSGNTNGEKERALETAVETVNPTDGNITIAYTNTRDLETITGIPNMAIYFGIAGLIALLAYAAMRKRKDDGIVEL